MVLKVTLWRLWRKQKENAKLKKKYNGNYFDEDEEMMKNFKTTLNRTRKRNICTGSNECECEDKKEKCENGDSRVEKGSKEWR